MVEYILPKVWKETPTLFMLVGLPASGKSTWAEIQEGMMNDIGILSSDIWLESYAKEAGKDYQWAFENKFKEANASMREDLKYFTHNNINIIWDQTNMSVKARRKKLSQIPKHYHKVAIVFEVDREELNERLSTRAEQTGKHIPQYVIDNITEQYIQPTLDEGFEKVFINSGKTYNKLINTMRTICQNSENSIP